MILGVGGGDAVAISSSPVDRRCAALCVLLVLAFSAACSPLSPSTTPVSLTIEPSTLALRVGEESSLRVFATRSDGSRSEVTGRWNASGPGVSVIANRVTGQLVGVQPLRVEAEGLAATLNISVVPDLRGAWMGTLHHATCNRYVGVGPSICGRAINGITYKFEIESAVQTGTLVLFNLRVSTDAIGLLRGRVDETGSIVFEDAVANETKVDGLFRLKKWTARFNDELGQRTLIAAGRLEREFPNAFGPQHYWMDATFQVERQ